MKDNLTLLNIHNTIDELDICVLIPTYNNHRTLRRVIDGVLSYTDKVIIVNDGSTDATSAILEEYSSSVHIINLPENKGKGNALTVGFREAIRLGYQYAITIDSDGQHYPSDIPVFVEALMQSEEKNLLLIGSRNMEQDGIPKKSSFGNKFSNFWFWFETGIKLTDTQSGYRLYPLKSLAKRYFTNKFEFEIEVIVRAAWNDVTVQNIPIQVLYDESERVSHFRPFKDFTRISILNTVLVTLLLLYIIPRNFFRRFKKKSFKDFLREDILGSDDSNKVKAVSIGLGVFIGIAPLWGLQSFLSIFLAITFRLNKVLAFTFSNVSIPPMIPIIVFASLRTGYYLVPHGTKDIILDEYTIESMSAHLVQYLVGSIVLASVMSVLFGVGSYILLSVFNKKEK
ncbi:DUF2062 domain-containing protein [Myroides marinus]|uniref:DUF2062 domain-containing protein n=1 Tax=Myroides marinus TaxID=703342 RepID=UPI00257568B0|nr:DUF2062 domain-containing protein [Myroides marinus]MDM1360574.1 DUF2062 domain-containing protein [Myroides marinus]MDM1380201.1 DUF2062 domain-containing protein [Myroides marinus]MDM1387441.1 DUF2062 domain-containing protein [Myroides marinus]MDM1394653.1 DUF2062 domain-containing protein [Myroides marinus]